MQKSELRKPLLVQRSSLDHDDKIRMDQAIGSRLLDWIQTHKPAVLGVYSPMRGEPDLQATFLALHKQGIRLALPTVVSDNAPLKFVEWLPGEAMIKDRFGAMMPAAERDEIFPHALVIPCVGFSQQLFRLGYGGGFYDRTVARAPRPHMVGVAYAFSLIEFEADSFDIAMDCVLTEREALR